MKIPFTNIEIEIKKIKNEEIGLDWFTDAEKKSDNPFNESTYFICMKILSESIAKLPLKAYEKTAKGGKRKVDHEILKILAERPNSYTNATSFWADVEMRRNHFGNAFVYLDFKKKRINKTNKIVLENIFILDNKKVKILIDDKCILSPELNKVYYQFRGDKDYIISSDQILHFRTSISNDGITGLSVREQLYNLLSTSKETEKCLESLLKNGMSGKAVLNYTSNLDNEAVNRMVRVIKKYIQEQDGNYNVIPLNPGMELKPLNISLNDAQFLENKKFISNQIASAFGVKPYFLNDYSGNNSIEFQNASFYIDTLMYILKHYEEELNYKLMSDETCKLKFNEKAILRLSASEQMEVLKSGVNNAVYTPNEARELLNLDSLEGGEKLICNGNYIPITEVGNQYKINQRKEVKNEDTKQESDN